MAIWSPYLMAKGEAGLETRVLYHERYLRGAMSADERLANAVAIFSPIQRAADGSWRLDAQTGWFWTYLTPPIAILSVIAFAWLGKRGEWRLAIFLGGWALLTCLPLVLFARVLFPRYGVAASVPFLLAAARPIGSALHRSFGSKPGRPLRSAALTAGLVLLLAWPIAAAVRQSADWSGQPLVAVDRSQFVSGWPGGSAVREAVEFLRTLSRKRPVVVLNVVADSFPNLAVAVAFERDPAVRVYYADWGAVVAGAESFPSTGRLVARRSFAHSEPYGPVAAPPGWAVVVVRPEPLTVSQKVVPESDVAAWGRLSLVARFANPRRRGTDSSPAIRIERIRRAGLE
jgi:hypothetical protein